MKFLLDTNVISELISRRPDPQVVRWIDQLDPDSTYLSVLTLGEIHRGIEKLPRSKKKETLRGWLQGDLLIRFSDRILPIDVGVMLTWGTLVGRLEREGRPLPAMDSLIAAVAIHHDCYLATRNVDDFDGTGVQILDPWD